MAAIDKILRKSNFAAAMTALIAKLNSLFVRNETGKGLSTNDYTSEEKAKLAGVAAGANNYVLQRRQQAPSVVSKRAIM